jgi:hypothetical protein
MSPVSLIMVHRNCVQLNESAQLADLVDQHLVSRVPGIFRHPVGRIQLLGGERIRAGRNLLDAIGGEKEPGVPANSLNERDVNGDLLVRHLLERMTVDREIDAAAAQNMQLIHGQEREVEILGQAFRSNLVRHHHPGVGKNAAQERNRDRERFG